MAEEANLALVELLQQRNDSLNQQVGDLEEQLRGKDEVLVRLQQRLDEKQIECEAERQRANHLQQAADAEGRSEAALIAEIQRLQEESAAQQAGIAEAEAKSHVTQERLEMTIAQLTKRTQVQLAVLNRERAQLLRRIAATKVATGKVATIQAASSLCFRRIVPHLRSLLAAYDQGQEGNPTNHTSASPALAVSARRPNTKLTRLLQQASREAQAQQEMAWQALMARQKELTCPLSRELFADPVITGCCGRTCSRAPLRQAFEQSLACPFCQAREVGVHENRAIARLVELHRSERLAFEGVATSPADAT